MSERRTLFQKIWDSHVVAQEPGAPAVLYVDLQLVHEVTSPQAFTGLRGRGLRVRRPDRTVATADHSIPTRGPVVDEKALHTALTTKVIAAAGLDVMVEEPPIANHPLFALENVTFTPHTAGPTWDNWFKAFRNAFDNVQRVERGERPLWVIPELRQ